MNRYVKKPIAIEAVKWKGFNNDEIKDFAGDSVKIEVIREGDADNGIPPSVDCSIETLEGVMKANVGDYIIKGVNGEFYPCKQDIFEKTYDKADDSSVMCFGDAIEVLKQGGTVRRSGWNGKGLMVFKQVPAHIDSDIIPKMQSLPQSAKELIVIDRFYPSSKTCSRCGWKNKDLKLSDRTFVCKDCGLEIDRDLNAAINIQAVGVDAAIRTQSSRVAGCVEASKIE